MAKKIISALLGGIAVLLVLAFGFMVVWSNQSYLTPAITWLLCGCIAVLTMFVLYVVITRIIDAVKRRGQDEETYNEEHIENILSGERARKRYTERSAESRRLRQESSEQKKEGRRSLEEERAIRKQEEFEARRKAEREAAEKKEEELFQKKRAEDLAKIENMMGARSAAIRRAADLEDEEEQNVALAEAEALGRAIQEARSRLEEEDNEREVDKQSKAAALAAEREEIEKRKAAAIESARKQAEAAETTRRRAAASAAQTQSFAPITNIGSLPEFNSQIIEKAVKATDRNESLPGPGATIWEKMDSPQSAKPVLGSQEDSEELGSTKNMSWTYSPAKLPNAWKTENNKKTIPGDMTSVSQPTSAGSAAKKNGVSTDTQSFGKTAPQAHAATAAKAEKPASSLAAKAEKSGQMRSAAKGSTQTLSTAEIAVAAAKQANAAAQEAEEPPKRPRGRPPKPKTEEELNAPKRPRGRPPKPKTEEELNKPKRPRGRPPKPKTEEELNAPKRPRGRPPKPKTEEELAAIAAQAAAKDNAEAKKPAEAKKTTAASESGKTKPGDTGKIVYKPGSKRL